jgi:2-polyprenyl-6-methoxyphenol hydroxylase-like FAD-dependent oxidoreductase
MTAVETAIVIGAGIGGPIAALALRKVGIDATVFEAHPSSAERVGAMLTVAPNGLDAMRIVGADEVVRTIGQPMRRTIVADGNGRRLAEFGGLSDLQPSQAVWRPALHRALHDQAIASGVRIVHDKRLVGVEELPGSITAQFADRSGATADILVGSDGIHSAVRSLIDPSAPAPEHVPLLNFGGVAALALPIALDSMYFVFGTHGFVGYWRQLDDTTAWFANLPHDEPMTLRQTQSVSSTEWLVRLGEAYGNDTPARDLIARTPADQLSAFGSVEIMPSVPHWHRGRMVLLGDAVHAPSPSSGQGASLAAESAIELARCLRDLPDHPTAFAAYEGLRRRRVEKVAARAARTNATKTLGPVALALMRLLMPIAIRTVLTPERSLGPEQRHHIEWNERVT